MSFSTRFVIKTAVFIAFIIPISVFAQDVGGPPGPPAIPKPTADDKSVTTAYQTAATIQLSGALIAGSLETLTFSIVTNPSTGSLGSIQSDNTIVYTPNSGFSGSDSFTYKSIDGVDESDPATVSITVEAAPAPPAPDTVTLTLRNGSLLIAASSTLELSSDNNAVVSLTPTAGGAHDAKVNSVLGVLNAFDTASSDFAVSDLQYFSSFSSFYVNCITAPADPGSPLCGNWLYVVNGTDPLVGMDGKMFVDNDVVYVYFGSSRRVLLSTTTAETGQSFTATAQSYNAVDNTYSALTGVTIGIKNSGGTEVTTSAVNGSGEATFTLSDAGSYVLGITQDFYFPSTNLTITAAPAASTSTPEAPSSSSSSNTSSGGGGGGGSGGTSAGSRPQFDVPKALAFLAAQQKQDGSFSNDLLTDWSAIAFSLRGADDAYGKLRTYLQGSVASPASVTDYERHAMALQALDINPYSGTPKDYISPIILAFDGTQIGDASLVNDDIFAIFPLVKMGYGMGDDVFAKTVAHIFERQLQNGSWENSVDLTAASMQALSLSSSPSAASAISKAREFLKTRQVPDGGFGNDFSTSWVLMALAALNESSYSWIVDGKIPTDPLAISQQADGGVGLSANGADNRIWATAYAIPGASNKTWNNLLKSFPKPPPPPPPPPTVATSTEPVTEIRRFIADLIEPLVPEGELATTTIATTTPTTPATTTALTQSAAVASIVGSPGGLDWSLLIYLIAFLAAAYFLWALYSILRDVIRWFAARF